MADQNDKQKIAELQELNEELIASLGRCRAILNDCRERLAANSNEAEENDDLSQSG